MHLKYILIALCFVPFVIFPPCLPWAGIALGIVAIRFGILAISRETVIISSKRTVAGQNAQAIGVACICAGLINIAYTIAMLLNFPFR